MKWFTQNLQSSSRTEDEEALLSSADDETYIPLTGLSTASGNAGLTLASTSTCGQIPRLVLNALYQLLIFIVPSFLQRPQQNISLNSSEKVSQSSSAKKYSTEYLDGVRGLASFFVYIFHFSHTSYPGANTGYGAKKNSSILQLPMLRLFFSGAAMVSIFFVVSGYVLTHRFVQKMHRHQFDSLFSSLTSLTFRRTIRLFLPAGASVILAIMCASLGFISLPKTMENRKFHHGLFEIFHYIDHETNPWTWDIYITGFYNPHLWSIAVEYRGSMVAFLTVLGIARCRTIVRVVVEAAIVTHALGHKRWDVALFIAGMLVAEMDVLVSISTSRKAFMGKKRIKAVLLIVMFVGIWLSGFPRDNANKSWGYGFLQYLWPFSAWRRRFWTAIAAILIVGPMPFLPLVQAFFCTKPIRYLGKISYALYLIHGLGNRTIGKWIQNCMWDVFGKEGNLNFALAFTAAWLVYTPIIIWWSDIFWRAFDLPATKFAKWFEGKCASTPDE